MKHIFLSLCLFLSVSPVWSQAEFAPLGAAWEYHYIEGWTSDTGTLRVVYSGDTTLFGKSYKRLCVTKGTSIFFPDACADGPVEQLFIAQSNDSVFINFGFPNLLYAFKLNYNVGDTVTFPMLYSTREFAVTKIDSLLFGTQVIRRFQLEHYASFGGSLNTFVYDFFGPELSFFSNWWGIAADWDSYFLCSYKDAEHPKIYLSGVHCAETLGDNPLGENASELVLSPNPTADFLQFKFRGPWPASPSQVAVYDPQGRAVLRNILNPNDAFLNVGHLRPGIYFVVVQVDGTEFRQKFVKY